MLEQKLEQDLKAALLAGNRDHATVLRGLKSTLLYAKVAEGKRDTGLSDEAVIVLFRKEAKKRQESADLYIKGGDGDRAQAELNEKAIIESYLPAQLSEEALGTMIDEAIAETGAENMQAMGAVINVIKQKAGGAADGAVIARLVKEKLSK